MSILLKIQIGSQRGKKEHTEKKNSKQFLFPCFRLTFFFFLDKPSSRSPYSTRLADLVPFMAAGPCGLAHSPLVVSEGVLYYAEDSVPHTCQRCFLFQR